MNKEKYEYLAIFTFEDDGISVEFPDLPGCLTCGDNEDDALKMAKECLELHLFGIKSDNELIPKPSQDISLEKNQKLNLITAII